jgi:hypothetical protein
MAAIRDGRLLEEQSIDLEENNRPDRQTKRPARTVTVNVAESPLGWLRARGLVTATQFEAGERLRFDWERGQLSPNVTMHWDAAPIGRRRDGATVRPDLTASAIDARKRFDAAISAAGPGLADILWRVVCAGEGMRDAETALGWPARAGKLVLTLALDRVAAFYRIS